MRKRRSKARKDSSDDSEVDLNITDDEDVEVLECIEVEM